MKPGVVIVFADRQPAGKLISAAKRLNRKHEFLWVGSDAWASRESVTDDREEFVEGAIAIQPLRKELPNFNEYFQDLIEHTHDRRNNLTNPWFDEYLLAYHEERITNNSTTQKLENISSPLSSQIKYQQPLYVHFVRDTVYAFANAIHNLHNDSCQNFEEDRLCGNFRERIFVDLVHYLRSVVFDDVDKKEFKFTGNGRNDGPPRYSIASFRKTGSLPHEYDWQNVGTFHGNDNYGGKIECKDPVGNFCTQFQDKNNPLFGKLKKCKRQDCNVSEIKVPETNDKCCWHCKQCGPDEYRATEFECKRCPEGFWSGEPNTENRSFCVVKEESYLEYSDTYAIGNLLNLDKIDLF